MVKVLKRTGKLVDFDKERIITAITKAYKDVRQNEDIPEYATLDIRGHVTYRFDINDIK